MERNETAGKIRVAGKVMKIVARVLEILAFIAAGILLLAGVAAACVPEGWIQVSVQANATFEMNSTLPIWKDILQGLRDHGGYVFENGVLTAGEETLTGTLTTPFLSNMPVTKFVAVNLILFSLRAGAYGAVLVFVSRFGRTLEKSETPFSLGCIRYLKISAYVLLGWAVLGGGFNILTRGLVLGRFVFGYSVDFGMVVVALVLLMVAYIFEYGAKLQEEHDQTL